MMFSRALAEFVGTFWLVFAGCGSAILAAAVADVGIGWLGVSLAFGLSVTTMAYAVGHVSGGHFNPAVTLGLTLAGRFDPKDVAPYWLAQVAGAVAAAALLYFIVAGQADFAGTGGFATNGFADASPQNYGMVAAIVTEVVLTAVFLIVILGATSARAPQGFAPLAIGLTLTLIHMISIPIDNTSVNPARSTGVAMFADGPALLQLWVFWVAPLVGAAIGALIWQGLEDG